MSGFRSRSASPGRPAVDGRSCDGQVDDARAIEIDRRLDTAIARVVVDDDARGASIRQDVRRLQFERGPLGKLRRAVPALRVTYTARTASGLYEQSDEGYGEIRYSLAGRTESSRIVTDEGALETIFRLADVKRADEDDMPYRGRPLVARPTGAIFVFHVLWPVSVALIGFGVVRRRT